MGRIGLVFTNVAILIPVYIVLLVSAILSSIIAGKLSKFTDQSDSIKTVRKYVGWSTTILWILFVGSLIFFFTIGFLIIPYLVSVPYFYGTLMLLFAIGNIVLSGYFFYTTNIIYKSKDYTSGSSDAKSAFKYSLSVGLMMLFASIFMIWYAIWSMRAYHKEGGLTGDISIAAELAVPELAPFASAAKAMGGTQKLTAGQEATKGSLEQWLALGKTLGKVPKN
jgi:hypothetical protein